MKAFASLFILPVFFYFLNASFSAFFLLRVVVKVVVVVVVVVKVIKVAAALPPVRATFFVRNTRSLLLHGSRPRKQCSSFSWLAATEPGSR